MIVSGPLGIGNPSRALIHSRNFLGSHRGTELGRHRLPGSSLRALPCLQSRGKLHIHTVLGMLKNATSRGRDLPPQGSREDRTHGHDLTWVRSSSLESLPASPQACPVSAHWERLGPRDASMQP